MTDRRKQARAIVLAAVMVLSIVGGTVAIAGTAAAAQDTVTIHDSAQGSDITDSEVADGTTVYVKATDSGTSTGGTNTVTVTSPNGDSISVTVYDDGSNSDSGEGDGDYWGSFTITSGATDDSSDTLSVDDTNSATAEADLDGSSDSGTASISADYTSPTVSESVPATASGTVDVTTWFSISDDDGGSTTYAYSADDGSSWTDITSSADSFDTNTLSDGDVQFRATDTDNAGNEDSATGTTTVDNTQPTATFDEQSFAVSGAYDLTTVSTVQNADTTTYEYSEDDGSSWTDISDEANWDTTTLNDGDVLVRVTVEDSQGNSDEATATAAVDNTDPTVEGIDVTQTPINDTTRGNQQLVTITFSEAMDTSQEPQIDYDDGTTSKTLTVSAKEGVGNNGFGVDDGYDAEERTWTGVIDANEFPDGANATADLTVSSAQDPAGNSLDSEANSDTVYVDTQEPDVKIDSIDSPASGTIDVTSFFTVDAVDDDDLDEEYFLGDQDKKIESPTEFDTTQYDDGELTFSAKATDDVGNSDSSDETSAVRIDNEDPSASVTFEDGETVAGDIAVTDVFDFEKGANEELTFIVDDGDEHTVIDGESDPSSFSEWDSDGANGVDDGTTVTFKVTVDQDPNADPVTKEVSAVVDNADGLDVDTTALSNGNVGLTLTPEPGAQKKDVLVYVNQSDNTGSASTALTEDDFAEVQDRFGDYHYYAEIGGLPDGSYDVRVVHFIDEHDRTQTQVDFDGSDDGDTIGADDDISIDQSAPSIENAYVTDAASDQMTVNVVFDEAVTGGAPADFDSVGGTSVGGVDASVDDDSTMELTLDDNIQTGGAPDVSITDAGSGIDEAYDNGDDPAASVADGDYTELHTLQVTLDAGLNAFSVPAESGGISADRLAEHENFESIWYYDAAQGEWVNHIPGTDDEDLDLYGGQGYLVEMSGQAMYDLNVDNQVSNVPNEHHLKKGWNLIGHYQEGSQSADNGDNNALDSIGGEYETNQIYQQSAAFPTAFEVLPHGDNLEPGEAYWVRMNSDNQIYTHEPFSPLA